MSFFRDELAYQLALRRAGAFPASGQTEERYGLRVLPKDNWDENLHASIREATIKYFKAPNREQAGGITWHRMCGHLLSSQVACINFLMPFATRPEALSALLAPLYPGESVGALPIKGEGLPGETHFVAFEWTGRGNHLAEAKAGAALTRGANCTSADAMVLVKVGGRTEMLLIEWKYTEHYGAPVDTRKRLLADGTSETSNDERRRRYADKLFWPAGPLKPTTEFSFDDLLWEPFYQLARQQMLAFQLQKAGEECADRVRVLHIAPSSNHALTRVTAPKLRYLYPGRSSFDLWQSLLVDQTDFIKASTGSLFGTFDGAPFGLCAWQADTQLRYAGALASDV